MFEGGAVAINLNQLRVFYVAARESSYRRAAEVLYITQPAVTQNIRSLERFVGLPLFQKSGRRMELTHAGRILFRYARRIFEAAEEAEQAMREVATVARGELRVGTTKIYARYIMPSIISLFRDRHPEVTVVLEEGSSEQMVQSVENHGVQLAVVGRMDYPPRIRSQHFHDVVFVLVCAAGHPFAGRTDLSWTDLEGQPLIVRERGSGSGRAVRERLAREGVDAKVVMASGSVDFIRDFVVEGKGVSFLYEPDIREELSAGRLVHVPLPGEPVTMATDIVTRDDANSPAIRSFVRVLQEYLGLGLPVH